MNKNQFLEFVERYLSNDQWLQHCNPKDIVIKEDGTELSWLGSYALPRQKSLTHICQADSLRKIHFNRICLNKNAMIRVAQALRQNCTLSEIFLDDCAISSLALRQFAFRLQKNTTIKSLSLQSNRIGAEHCFGQFEQLFLALPKLLYLNLQDNYIDYADADDFHYHSNLLTNLQVFYGDNNRADLHLPQAIVRHQRQQIFYASPARVILKTLPFLQCLKVLQFRMNLVPNDSFSLFCYALEAHPHLCSIDLRHADDRFGVLVQTMARMKKLIKFSVHCTLNKQQTQLFCQNWLQHESCQLQVLQLHSNVCDLEKIFENLYENKTLREFTVFLNTYKMRQFIDFLNQLHKRNPTLKVKIYDIDHTRGKHRHPTLRCSAFFECVFLLHTVFDRNLYIYLWIAEFLCDQDTAVSLLTQFEKIGHIKKALHSIDAVKSLRRSTAEI